MKEKIIAILPAAGHGSRMGAGQNKLRLALLGRPVLAYTLEAFENCPSIDEVILVANEQDIFLYRELVKDAGFQKVKTILRGGETRAQSVHIGVLAAEDASVVVIHDGARPLVTPEILEKTIAGSRETGAAIAAVPVIDTIKRAEGGTICETPRREELWQAQTPQVFRRELLLSALENASDAVTDDASAVELAGVRVRLVEANRENIKLTTPFDLLVAEAVLRARGREACE